MKRIVKVLVCFALMIGLAYTPVMVPQLENTPVVATAEAATKVKLNKKSAVVRRGATLKLKMQGTKKAVKWTTSDKSIATVSKKGVVTGKKPGKVKITAKVGKKKYVCNITVKNRMTVAVKNVQFTEINKSKTVKVTFVGNGSIYWDCDNMSVVEPSWIKKWNGNTTTLKLTAKGAGTATVKLTNDMNKEVCKIKVTVTNKKWDADSLMDISDYMDYANDYLGYAYDEAEDAFFGEIYDDEDPTLGMISCNSELVDALKYLRKAEAIAKTKDDLQLVATTDMTLTEGIAKAITMCENVMDIETADGKMTSVLEVKMLAIEIATTILNEMNEFAQENM